MRGDVNVDIEDVLRQHSVQELRELVQQLQQEGQNKQTELQQMVGSTYHDFIQSADTIASMQDKSYEMNKQLRTFGELTENIAEKTKDLLVKASLAGKTPSNNLSPRKRSNSVSNQPSVVIEQEPRLLSPTSCFSPLNWTWRDITSCKVWNYLDECDIFSACQVIVTAATLLVVSDELDVETEGDELQRRFSSRARQLITFSSSESDNLLQQCGGVSYLHQTVVDDCSLIFLHGQCDAIDSARNMAGLAGLSLCSALYEKLKNDEETEENKIVSGGELLRKYLEGTDLRLQELCKRLLAGGRDEGDESDEVNLDRLASLLVDAVQLLQETIYNVYLIFFKKVRNSSGTSVGRNSGEDGLFCGYLVDFLAQCIRSEDDKDLDKVLTDVQTRVTKQYPQSAVLTAWRSWIIEQTKSLQMACISALTYVNTAHDVARAQQLTLHQCVHFSSTEGTRRRRNSDENALSIRVTRSTSQDVDGFSGENKDMSVHDCEKNDVWNAACSLLLLPFTLTNTSGSKRSNASLGSSSAMGGLALWSHVFRKPFLTQVEKMLKVSCRDIFQTTKKKLLRTIILLGGSADVSKSQRNVMGEQSSRTARGAPWLSIDSDTLEVKVRESDGHLSSRFSPCDSEWCWVDAYTGEKWSGAGKYNPSSQRVASSAEIFLAAESIRYQLENDISEQLLTDIFEKSGSLEDQDLESTTALARSLQVQCCELVGQMLVLLRVLVNNISATMKQRRVDILNKAKRSPEKGGGNTGSTNVAYDGESSLQSAVLLLTRLAWLLRSSQGTFLEYSLQMQQGARNNMAPTSPKGALSNFTSVHMNSHQQYMTSLDQLQSAFDIADTDGDGIITFDEAVEAVNALWIADDLPSSSSSDPSPGPASFEFLWFDNSPVDEVNESQTRPQTRNRPVVTYTMPEFRLVCSQMIPPPPLTATIGEPTETRGIESDEALLKLELPHLCLRHSLSSLVKYSLKTFADTIVQLHLESSLLSTYNKDFPFAVLDVQPGDGVTNFKNLSLLESFRFSWKTLDFTSKDEKKEDGDDSLDDLLQAPVLPSYASYKFLTTISQISHYSFLSIDTTQSLTLLSRNDTGSNSLMSTAQDYLYSQCVELYLRSLTTVHEKLLAIVEKTSGGDVRELFEDYCVQMIFDLTLCECSILSSLSPSAQYEALKKNFTQCIDMWEQHIDPINWSLLSSRVKILVNEYRRFNYLFLPCGDLDVASMSLKKDVEGDKNYEKDSDITTSTDVGEAERSGYRFRSLFPVTANVSAPNNGEGFTESVTSKFSILPLPLTSTIASYDDRTDRHGTVVNRDTLTLRGGRHYTEKGHNSGPSSQTKALKHNESIASARVNGHFAKGASENSNTNGNKKGSGWFF